MLGLSILLNINSLLRLRKISRHQVLRYEEANAQPYLERLAYYSAAYDQTRHARRHKRQLYEMDARINYVIYHKTECPYRKGRRLQCIAVAALEME